MSIQSFPFTSINGDRAVTASQFRKFWAGFASNGVLNGYLNELNCAKNGMNIIIGTGAALINGAMAVLEATESVAVTATSSARYATIVLEFNDNDSYRNITAKAVYGSSSAQATLTQNETVYQLPLCAILVPANATSLVSANLIDQRPYSSAVDYRLPNATPYTLGGVKPIYKTDEMTQAVGVDSNGLLFTNPGGGGNSENSMIGNGVFYGSCLTVGSARIKEITCSSDFVLRQGTVINVFFLTDQDYAASTSSPMVFKINNGSEIEVMRYGSVVAPADAWRAGEIVSFVYSGSEWVMLDGTSLKIGDGGSYTLPVATSTRLGGVMPVAKTSGMTQEVGVDSNGKLFTELGGSGSSSSPNNGINYGTCPTAAGTRAKVVTCSGFELTTGSVIFVKFTYAQTYAATASLPVTINVNNTGAKSVMLYGTTFAPSGAWVAGEVKGFVYDGTNWLMIGANVPDGNEVSY